ncbi:MAG: DUF1980 domain-containing protein [Verrucomicrobiae bacterium]|nr:DUF1980 domain-containing protein [Verrucomicrobiae bacterium]
MKARSTLNYIAILVLLFWGSLFVYFYLTGRIDKHIDVNFRVWALVAGLGLCVLGLFNLATAKQAVACGHDHGHDHDHEGGCCGGHGHGHSHDHKEGCCGGHGHEHDHPHHHDEPAAVAHSHAHHEHDHDHGCCGHDHDHGHDSGVAHEHEHNHEQTTSGLVTAILILSVPLMMAAHFSQDKFSSDYVSKWGKITTEIHQLEIARKREAAAKTTSPEVAVAQPNPDATPAADPNAPAASAADTPPDASGSNGGAEWGSFTMADLERMVPKNEAGNFMLDVPQIFYTAGDEELMKVMEGIPVETTAQVMEEKTNNAAGKRLKLFRLFVECCAADARPLSIPIEFASAAPKYEEMGWVKVIGKIHYATEDGNVVPLIQVQSMEATAEPMDMMLY